MLRALQNLLGLQPWRTAGEVWAEPIAFAAETAWATLLFTNTATFARDPHFLSRWSWQTRAMRHGLYPPRTPTDMALRNWGQRAPVANQVDQLLSASDLGVDLFGVNVQIPRDLLPPDFNESNHDGSVLRIDCSGTNPVVLGAVGAEVVARERLGALHRSGAKPLIAARVQANSTLYAAAANNAPAFLVFSFDPAVTPTRLEEVAEMIFDLKSNDTQNPVLQAAAAGPRANDAYWFYHRRFRIPAELTEGRLIYAADLWVHRPFLRDHRFLQGASRLLPVLAQPGDTGGVELMPHDQVTHAFPVEQASLLQRR